MNVKTEAARKSSSALSSQNASSPGNRVETTRSESGDDPSVAVVAEPARRLLSRWDSRVTHDEVTVDVVPG